MLAPLVSRLTYSNLLATLAIFIALGGTSYAVLDVPRNSIGARQIKPGSVGSSEIRSNAVRSRQVKSRSLRLSDLSRQSRRALKGQRGSTGLPGPPGAPAPRFLAAVSASGTPVRGNATTFEHTAVGSGSYTIGFAQSTGPCVYGATLGTTDGSTVPGGRIVVRDDGGRVGVQTYDTSGSPADLPFHLIAAC